MFIALLRGLFAEGLLPNSGDVIDAGANNGLTTCKLAALALSSTVYAIDPSPSNVQHIKRKYTSAWPNIKPLLGVLGNRQGTMSLDKKDAKVGGQVTLRSVEEQQRASGRQIDVLTTDGLFGDEAHTLGFAHWDVEGWELNVLEGSQATLWRDRPVFTAELHVHQDIAFSRRLLSYAASLGYEAWVLEEICGLYADCRNLLFLHSRVVDQRDALVLVNGGQISCTAEAVPGDPCVVIYLCMAKVPRAQKDHDTRPLPTHTHRATPSPPPQRARPAALRTARPSPRASAGPRRCGGGRGPP